MSDGIAEAMKKHHNIDVPINVIRSAAFAQNVDVRPTQRKSGFSITEKFFQLGASTSLLALLQVGEKISR